MKSCVIKNKQNHQNNTPKNQQQQKQKKTALIYISLCLAVANISRKFLSFYFTDPVKYFSKQMDLIFI